MVVGDKFNGKENVQEGHSQFSLLAMGGFPTQRRHVCFFGGLSAAADFLSDEREGDE